MEVNVNLRFFELLAAANGEDVGAKGQTVVRKRRRTPVGIRTDGVLVDREHDAGSLGKGPGLVAEHIRHVRRGHTRQGEQDADCSRHVERHHLPGGARKRVEASGKTAETREAERRKAGEVNTRGGRETPSDLGNRDRWGDFEDGRAGC